MINTHIFAQMCKSAQCCFDEISCENNNVTPIPIDYWLHEHKNKINIQQQNKTKYYFLRTSVT